MFLTSLKQTCNEYLYLIQELEHGSLRIRAHLSWRTGKHLHVLHVLRTYSTCSYPGYQNTTTYAALFIASLQIYSGLTFFLGKVALEKVSLDANTRKGGHFETLGKRLFIGPLALATFLLVLAGDAFSPPLRSNISNAKHKFRSTHTHTSKH